MSILSRVPRWLIPAAAGFGAALVLLLLAKAFRPAPAEASPKTEAVEESPSEVVTLLKKGNERFVSGETEHPHSNAARRQETAEDGQHPVATILTCADSRVPPERLFDQGVGDVFVVRVAGNVCDTDELATIEYGTDHLKTPLFVVLGHSKCGAVTAVASDAELHGHLPELLDNVQPAVESVREAQPKLKDDALVEAAVEANIWQAIEDALAHSAIVRERIVAGHLEVQGAVYDIETGAVRWLGRHPNQYRILAHAGEEGGGEEHGGGHDESPRERES